VRRQWPHAERIKSAAPQDLLLQPLAQDDILEEFVNVVPTKSMVW